MPKENTRGRKKLPALKKKQLIQFFVEGNTIKRHGGKIATVEKCKQFLEDDGN